MISLALYFKQHGGLGPGLSQLKQLNFLGDLAMFHFLSSPCDEGPSQVDIGARVLLALISVKHILLF